MSGAISIIDEIEQDLSIGTSAKRCETLRRVADLFLSGAPSYTEEHVSLFDAVIERLIEQIEPATIDQIEPVEPQNAETAALASLSERLAPVENAPVKVVRRLSRHDNVEIAGPVLELSPRLTDDDLSEVASTKSQRHLVAIALRSSISPRVTDVLVGRGDTRVIRTVAGNEGARFSDNGYGRLTSRAGQDAELALKLAQRTDYAPERLKELVQQATEEVKRRLAKHPDPALKERLNAALVSISEELIRKRGAPYGTRRASVVFKDDLEKTRELIHEFAVAGDLAETTRLLAHLVKLPEEIVRHVFSQTYDDGLLILCKAANLGWPAAKAILAISSAAPAAQESDFRSSFEKYVRLSADNAQRVVRFLTVRKNLSDSELRELIDPNQLA